jgi:hypothetical protein
MNVSSHQAAVGVGSSSIIKQAGFEFRKLIVFVYAYSFIQPDLLDL